MHTYTVPKFLATLLLLSLLAACVSMGSTTITHPNTHLIPTGKSANLTVQPSSENSEQDYLVVSARLRSLLANNLISKRIFGSIVDSSRLADYYMDVKVVSLYKVSVTTRALFGIFAGTDSIDISVEVRERITNELVTTFQVSGSGAVWTSAQSAALQEIIDEVISALR